MIHEKIKYVETEQTISFHLNNKSYVLYKENPDYKYVYDLFKVGEWDEIHRVLNPEYYVEDFYNGIIKVERNNIFLNGEKLPHFLGVKIVEAFNLNDRRYDYLVKFWEKLKSNPSLRSIKTLYNYLEKHHFAIVEDGDFIAYKKVTKHSDNNLYDSHTGTIRNDVNTTVSVDRNEVDENPDNHCSFGLHVANYEYAKEYNGNVLIVLKVNPKNVVSVPYDCNFQKIRVSEYFIMSVHENEEGEPLEEIKSTFVTLGGDSEEDYEMRKKIRRMMNKE